MSRIGLHPVEVPAGVTIAIADNLITVKGRKETLTLALPDGVGVAFKDGKVTVTPANDSKQVRALWGTVRNRIRNMVQGVTEGFTVGLEITGVGYRASVQGKTLQIALGFSHPVSYDIPSGIEVKCPKQTEIIISGADKQKVGQVAAEIRRYRKPEPYKGKGVKYVGEKIRRKEGKKK